MNKYTCPKCDGEWIPRVEKPVLCPRCKFRLHTVGKTLDRMLQKKEGAKSDRQFA